MERGRAAIERFEKSKLAGSSHRRRAVDAVNRHYQVWRPAVPDADRMKQIEFWRGQPNGPIHQNTGM